MATKIITVEATPPAESTGADYYKGAPLNAAEFDQNIVNLRAAVDRKASLNNPTFTGTVTLPSTTSIGDVSATELQYLNSVTSNVQDQINAKAPINNPTFTGTVSLSTGTANGVLYLNGSKQVTSGSGLVFDSSGKLLVGTASSSSIDRLAVISSEGTADTALIQNSNSSTFASNVLVLGATRTTTDSTFNFLTCVTQGTALRLHIRDSGNVVNQNNSYGAISDAKLKENIVDASPKLDKLTQVRVVNYNLKTDPDQKLLGVVAQELEQIFPGMVEETHDYEEITKTRTINIPAVLDEEGNEVEPATTKEEEYTERVATGTTTKSVKYSVFVPMLIKAVQEQQAIIESLTQRIEALEYTKQGE